MASMAVVPYGVSKSQKLACVVLYFIIMLTGRPDRRRQGGALLIVGVAHFGVTEAVRHPHLLRRRHLRLVPRREEAEPAPSRPLPEE